MVKKFQFIFSALLLLSMVLGACAPAAETQVADATAVILDTAPTSLPAAPTAEPTAVPPTATPEPAPDVLALFQALVASIPADKGFGAVKPAALAEELKGADKPFLVDVREATEVEKDGFIEGAINLPVRVVLRNLDKLPALDAKIVVYCGSGHRGGMISAALRLLGYTNVRNVNGGLNGWKAAKLPVVTGSKPADPVKLSTAIIADQALYNMLDGFLSVLPDGFYSLGAAKVKESLDSATPPTLVDVRTLDEWTNDGYIQGAVNIPLTDFFKSLDKLPQDKSAAIVIYCGSGHRGAMAMMGLRLLGYTNVNNLGGGLNGWKNAKLPVVGWVDWTATWADYLKNLPADFYSVKADVLSRQLADKAPFLLDVREPAEVAGGFIKGAINLPVRDVLKNLDKLPAKDQPIVIYCGSGHRGAMVMSALRMLGYTDVRNLNGGFSAWKKGSFPVETGTMAAPAAGTAPEVDSALFRGLNAFLLALPEDLYSMGATKVHSATLTTAVPFLVDVRNTVEVTSTGYITGSVNIPINTLFENLAKLPADKTALIVTLCQSGHRGSMAMMVLRMAGYTNVYNMGGGMNAWVSAKYGVKK